MIWTWLFACNDSGSILVNGKLFDTGNSVNDPEPEAEPAAEPEVTDRSWTGHREITFENQCTFSIYETGARILDEQEEIFQLSKQKNG